MKKSQLSRSTHFAFGPSGHFPQMAAEKTQMAAEFLFVFGIISAKICIFFTKKCGKPN